MKLFAVERVLYLICAVCGFALTVLCIVLLVVNKSIGFAELSMSLGASGIIAASSARITQYLSKSFDLIELITKQILDAKGGRSK